MSVKWAKQKYQVELDPSCCTLDFKATVHELTGVPPKKMKLMVKGAIVKDEPDWSQYSGKLKEGMMLMMMGSADPSFVAGGGAAAATAAGAGAAAAGGGAASARELLEEAAAAAPLPLTTAAPATKTAAAAAAAAAADDVALGPPLCRVSVKHGAVEYPLSLRGVREGGDDAASFDELLVSDVMRQLFAASGVPPDQQKLVHKGTVLDAGMSLGADRGIKPAKDGVPAAKMVLMGTDKYHRAQAEGTLLATTEQELVALETDCASAVSAASHRADRALIQVRISRMIDVACGMRSRLQAVHWRGDGMEDEPARQALLTRLTAVDEQLESVRKHI